MRYHSKILLFVSIFLSLISESNYAQSQQSSKDSTFYAYMRTASVDLRNNSYSDSLQRKYSGEFYQYFKQNTTTKTGHLALGRAFILWGNLGEAGKMDSAMTQIGYDSKIWRQLIVPLSNGYHVSEQKTDQDYINLLQELKSKLTDPESKSELLYALARYYNSQNKSERVIELAREMIEINANPFYVEKALGFQHEAESLGIGVNAPGFQAETVKGQEISLSEQKGKIVLLEFWATWCGPCKPDIPYLKKITSKYSENELQVIGISLDSNPERLKEFIRKNEMAWPQILQPQKWDDGITHLYNVYVVPRSYIIGRDGKIVAKNIRGKKLEGKIADLLQQ